MTGKTKGRERMSLRFMYVIGALFILLLGLFLAGVLADALASGAGATTVAVLIIPFIGIAAVLVMFLKIKANAVNSGLPLKDEMTARAEGIAGRYTTLLTTWFLIALMWYQGFGNEMFGLPELAARHIIYLVLFLMLGLFIGLRWHYCRKGVM